ncbi:MAG: molybdenum cofactor biosynthesis protein B [Gammaproteobacteria bacterium]|nr:molybdenum cofactor biosynthesis protein B [Gammaproteobacteria bacterium]NIN61557.1 molybdenum cofactor biosynthesis protein B [Gammaproteobacteria bacterium]NIO62751.1 molybdenum cofactor biosynthesis protein B [Gammaproteobacteria bacterium]NIQ09610.1 molybdenum cofactor biosynthesis protein B [Gammaproteobacteria bacterium]NIQ19315.1 molybdenum cofactor biosynthesis protein B [Gammaproteobacteria bacterium]
MSEKKSRELIPVGIAVLTVSDSRTEADDKSGKLLVSRLQQAGHMLVDKQIVADDIYQIRAIISQWCINDSVQAILATGGTGITGRDGTPEAISVLLDKEIAGFGETFRAVSYTQIGTSTMQSRALAGVCNGTFIFSLPGSSNACATAWDELISKQLDFRTRPCNLVELMPRLLEK